MESLVSSSMSARRRKRYAIEDEEDDQNLFVAQDNDHGNNGVHDNSSDEEDYPAFADSSDSDDEDNDDEDYNDVEQPGIENDNEQPCTDNEDDGSGSDSNVVEKPKNNKELEVSGDNYSDEGTGSRRFRFFPAALQDDAGVQNIKIADLIKHLNSGRIDLDAPYQRAVVWNNERMIGLITSIVENYYIPPLIFNSIPRAPTDDDPSLTRLVCVDGKQRLSSIRKFIEGEIPCADQFGAKWYFVATKKTRTKFGRKTRAKFMNKTMLAYIIPNLNHSEEEELFSRVQKGMQLSSAEKLRASRGEWQALATRFQNDFPGYCARFNHKRHNGWLVILGSFNQIIECTSGVDSFGPPRLRTSAPCVKKMLASPRLLDSGIESRLRRVYSTLNELNHNHPHLFAPRSTGVKTFAPIEAISVAVLIAIYGEDRNTETLAKDIDYFRDTIRAEFKDLRMNVATWKGSWKIIDELYSARGDMNGTTIPKSKSKPTKLQTKSKRATASKGRQRKKSTKSPVKVEEAETANVDPEAETEVHQTLIQSSEPAMMTGGNPSTSISMAANTTNAPVATGSSVPDEPGTVRSNTTRTRTRSSRIMPAVPAAPVAPMGLVNDVENDNTPVIVASPSERPRKRAPLDLGPQGGNTKKAKMGTDVDQDSGME